MYFENEKRSHKRMETRVPTADPGLNARGGHREPEWYAVGQPSPAATSPYQNKGWDGWDVLGAVAPRRTRGEAAWPKKNGCGEGGSSWLELAPSEPQDCMDAIQVDPSRGGIRVQVGEDQDFTPREWTQAEATR